MARSRPAGIASASSPCYKNVGRGKRLQRLRTWIKPASLMPVVQRCLTRAQPGEESPKLRLLLPGDRDGWLGMRGAARLLGGTSPWPGVAAPSFPGALPSCSPAGGRAPSPGSVWGVTGAFCDFSLVVVFVWRLGSCVSGGSAVVMATSIA